jgi:hypothetical protein
VVRERLRTRAFKVLFLRSDPKVTFGDFAEFVDEVQSEATVLSLITPQVEQRAQQTHCLNVSERAMHILLNTPVR